MQIANKTPIEGAHEAIMAIIYVGTRHQDPTKSVSGAHYRYAIYANVPDSFVYLDVRDRYGQVNDHTFTLSTRISSRLERGGDVRCPRCGAQNGTVNYDLEVCDPQVASRVMRSSTLS